MDSFTGTHTITYMSMCTPQANNARLNSATPRWVVQHEASRAIYSCYICYTSIL